MALPANWTEAALMSPAPCMAPAAACPMPGAKTMSAIIATVMPILPAELPPPPPSGKIVMSTISSFFTRRFFWRRFS